MTETKKMTSKLVVVPASWITYDMQDVDIEEIVGMSEQTRAAGVPSIAVMEALVMVGRIKRVAAVHTFNALSSEDDESESPFAGEEDE